MAVQSTSFFTKTMLDELGYPGASCSYDLIQKIWPNFGLSAQNFQENEYATFIEFVGQQLRRLREHISDFAAESLEGTVELIEVLRSHSTEPQNTVIRWIQKRFPEVNETAVARTVELVLRLWLTVDAHLEKDLSGCARANLEAVEWPAELSLKDILKAQFRSENSGDLLHKNIGMQLDPSLTAWSLIDTCGVKISWSHNLAEHLNLDKRRRILTVYEHKICLLNHSKDKDTPFPRKVLHEAIDTLNLLFPFGHGPTRELLRREGKMPLYRLGICNRARALSINDYDVWRTQIADLVEVLNEPPRNWWQLFSDRRNMRDWATFLLGSLVLMFTLVSIAFGTVSCVYTIKQYNLALAQACAIPGAQQTLAGFCK